MKKLKLELHELRVESFGTMPEVTGRGGTVAAAEWRGPGDTLKPDCDVSGSPTCGYSNCGDETCGTCDEASWCGNSCVLVCDVDDVSA
ncbi:MAG TPA: hypothetical protein VM759_06820 [Longimicrobium sp.]|nr:hypothetical protein [Longimicrobium sp.]